MAKGICSGCKETFNSTSAFDIHRVGSYGEPIYAKNGNGKRGDIVGYTASERRCLSVQEMIEKGLLRNEKGWWVTSLYDENAHTKEGEPE